MSRVITSQLEVTDAELVTQALELAGVGHSVEGNIVYITSGPLHHATLHLGTGKISGDSDHGHTEESFGLLRQYYGEALVRREYAKNGTTIEMRETTDEGDIILSWSYSA